MLWQDKQNAKLQYTNYHNTVVIFFCSEIIRRAETVNDHGILEIKTSNFQRKIDLQAFLV